MIRLCYVSLIMLAVTAMAVPLCLAADAVKGAQLARQWCANCHVVDRSGPPSVQQGPPGFQSIGSLTGDQLRTFLTHPHGAMPDLALSRAEIDDVVAYIETLRPN